MFQFHRILENLFLNWKIFPQFASLNVEMQNNQGKRIVAPNMKSRTE